jgi:ATP-dependent helicase YprA (DUF1998 family)
MCKSSKKLGFPASQEFCEYLKKRIGRGFVKLALHVKIHELPTLKRYNVECHKIPIYDYKRDSKRFTDILSDITGLNVSPDVVKSAFSLNDDYNLFEHQISAINELKRPESKVVIVATPNASGKTEIGLFTAMDIIRGGWW